MAWHDETDNEKIAAFEENRKSFVSHNPDIDIITVYNPFGDNKQAWLSTDLSCFYWFRDNRGSHLSERYLIVEWDCWCDCDLKDYYNRVWDCDFVVPSVKYPERDDWYWFSTIQKLPIQARAYATGVTPFCGMLLSRYAMETILPEIIKPEYLPLNSELRLGTVATMLNIDPIVNPVYGRSLSWRSTALFDTKYPGLHHPRKKIKHITADNEV